MIQPEAVIIQLEQMAKLISLSQVGDHKAILNHTQKHKRYDYVAFWMVGWLFWA